MFRARGRFSGFLAVLLLATIPAFALPYQAPVELERTWFRLTGAFEPFDARILRERTDELLRLAENFELKRLTPYAQALVLKARTLPPGDRLLVLRQALRLDPASPEVLFELSAVSLGRFHPRGIAYAAQGLHAFMVDGRLGSFRNAGLGLILVLLVTLAGGGWALVTVGATLPRLWHDLNELAASWRMGANSWVFSGFFAGLPLFLTLDPLWWAFYLFALCWGYWERPAKLAGLALLVFLAASPTLVASAHRLFTHAVDPITRATWVLRESRYEPLALVELSKVADLFGDDPAFYRLKGDVERQYGLLEASLLSYQEGLRQKPNDAALLLSAGIAQYLQGNYGAAVQLFIQSRDSGYDPVIVNYNLSLAFAHLYNFRESDEAMAAARKASQSRLAKLSRGRDNKPIIPVFSLAEARAVLARKDPVALLNRGLLVPPLSRGQTIFSPLALGAVAALLLAVLHFLWRQRSLGFAKACSKCGRTFCSRCKLSRETQTYCTQCVNIFLKRDMVAPELQIAKQRHLARHERLLRLRRRLADAILPGLGVLTAGRPLAGVLILVPTILVMLAVTFWLPQVVGPLLLHADLRPIRAFLAGLWFLLLVTAQAQPKGER